MAEKDDLQALGQKIEAIKPSQEPAKVATSGLGIGMRLSIELLAGVLTGCFLGYYVDQWLGTKPWFMIFLFFLGAAAGFKNMLREAKKLANEESPK